MAAYATVSDVQAGMVRQLSAAEQSVCSTLLDRASLLIDAYNADASLAAKNMVCAQMVARALGDGDTSIPSGATQGSMSALGYSQSWTMGSGAAVGELYLTLMDRLAQALTASLAPIVAWVLIFAVTKLFLQLLCAMLDWDIPFFSGLNRMAGGLLGAVAGCVTIVVLCWAVMRFAPAENLGLLSQPCLLESFTGGFLAPFFVPTL